MMLRDLYAVKIPENKRIIPFDKSQLKQLESVNAGLDPVTPSREAIAAEQLEMIKSLYPRNAQLEEFIRNANLDMGKQFGADEVDDSVVISEVIESIERSLGMWYEGGTEGSAGITHTTITKEETESSLIKYRMMLDNLQDLYNKLGNSTDSFIQEKMQIIEQGITDLTFDLANYQSEDFTPRGSLHGGYIDKAIWLGHALKGRYLEVAATQWMGERVPENIKVVDTGRVYGVTYDILGGVKSAGKQLKSDILAFDMTKNVEVSYKIDGKIVGPVSLEKFLSDIESKSGSHSISIDNDNYQELSQAIVFGAQAKAGRGQSILNKNTVVTNLNEVMSVKVANDFSKALQLLVQAATTKTNNMLKRSDMYDAMFNMLLAKHLRYIIGKENNLIVTREGIYTLYDYMQKQWQTAKRIVKASLRVDISNPTKKIPLEYTGMRAASS